MGDWFHDAGRIGDGYPGKIVPTRTELEGDKEDDRDLPKGILEEPEKVQLSE